MTILSDFSGAVVDYKGKAARADMSIRGNRDEAFISTIQPDAPGWNLDQANEFGFS